MEVRRNLTRYAWLSIGAALLTMGLKGAAYWLTGSVGFLSDAMESTVNLVAALFALFALSVAARPPDHGHSYGHSKVEYFASAVEGSLILVAAVLIAYQAIGRLIEPEPLQDVAAGVLVSALAAAVNFTVARVLMRAGARYRSATLTADAHHLMTDVYTSAGVMAAVAAVGLTGWLWLDPVIALFVAAQILFTGYRLLKVAVDGLMDTSLPADEVKTVVSILDHYAPENVSYHALRTRQAGAQRFVSVHVQVPGSWSVQQGHELLEDVERDIRAALDPVTVMTHLEPVEDPASFEDVALSRPPENGARDSRDRSNA